MKILFWSVCSAVLLLLGFGAVAFATLLERKLLGLSQIRLGPNKVTFMGILQPVADGVKLLFKQFYLVITGQRFLLIISPVLLILLFMLVWSWVLPWVYFFCYKYSSLMFFCLLGVGAYSVVLVGWSSVSMFSKLGCMRGILQSLSFEVALILLFMVVLSLHHSLSLSFFVSSFTLLVFWCMFWVSISLMESNRAPFDLLEGESELISGFNVEMGSLGFVYIFLSEYGMLIILATILVASVFSDLLEMNLVFVQALLFVRSCFPRVRWDIMMTFMWQSFLPFCAYLFLLSSLFSL